MKQTGRFIKMMGVIAAMAFLIVTGKGQNNNSGGNGGKGSGGGTTGGSVLSDSLSMSQVNIEKGGTELVLAVVKNTGSASANFKIDTLMFGPSNGGAMEEQMNSVTLTPGQSFTQTMTVTPSEAGQYSMLSTFSVNGAVADVKSASFDVFDF